MGSEFVEFEQAVRSNDADTRFQLLTDDFVRRSKQPVYCLYELTRTVAGFWPLLGFEKLFLAAGCSEQKGNRLRIALVCGE